MCTAFWKQAAIQLWSVAFFARVMSYEEMLVFRFGEYCVSHADFLYGDTKIKEREEFYMKEFWNTIQFVFAAIGGWLGYFLGGCDGLIYALLAFMAADYLTGVMCAINDKKLSSEVGFKGICRKVLIFVLVGIANILDVQVVGTGSVLRTAIIFFLHLQ